MFFPLFFFCFLFHIVCVPQGLWENDTRILFFKQEALEVVLKMFYGWYYDGKNGQRNNTTSLVQKDIPLSFSTLLQEDTSWAGQISVGEGTFQVGKGELFDIIPLAVIDDSLYLDFGLVFDMGEGNTYIKRLATSNTIGRSPFYKEKEIECLYLTPDTTYQIRYWKTDMKYDEGTKASFLDEGKSFFVDKFLEIGGNVFTCCNSREVEIRTVSKMSDMAKDKEIIFNKEKTICGFGKPYLSKINTQGENEDVFLAKRIEEANERQHKIPGIVYPLENKKIHIEPFGKQDQRIKYRQSPY